MVMERLQQHHLRLAQDKCHFGVTSMTDLGHLITTDSNRPLPEHVETLRTAPRPTTRKQLRSFLGLSNWLWDYVPRCAEIQAPLNMLKNGVRFVWTAAATTRTLST